MMITTLGLALGVLFLLIPLCVAYVYHIDMVTRMLRAFFCMALRVGVLGVAVYYLVQTNSLTLSLLAALVFMLYSVVVVVYRARLNLSLFLLPVFAGMLVAVVFAAAILLFANVAIGDDFGTRYLLPVLALLSGSIVDPMAQSLATYYAGLKHHNHLYYYLIGNGATRSQAIDYLMKRALEKSFVPGLRRMAGVAVGVSPVFMWIMIVCGASAFDAVAIQILFMTAVFAASVVAAVVSLTIARRYVIDGYDRLKSVLVLFCICATLSSCNQIVKRMDAKVVESKNVLLSQNKEETDADFSKKKENSNAENPNLEIPARLKLVPEQILRRTGYTASYNSDRRVPNWVAWHLTPNRLTGEAKRNGAAFHEDEDVPEPRAVNFDYVRSGYDRGHMCPAGDNKWSAVAMDESFLFTNICPQAPSLNRGDWNEMEQVCRKWAKQYGNLYIVCGPIFYKGKTKTIGANKVAVPNAFFKVVLCMKGEPKAIGFIYKNADGNRPKGDYANSVDEVERITGIDFFPSLPDNIEKKVEAECNPDDWEL